MFKLRVSAFFMGLFLVGAPFGGVHAESKVPSTQQELVVYTYDSFMAKNGLGPEIFALFEKKCGCKIKAIVAGDSGQLLNRLQLDAERGVHVADIVVGLDLQSWERAQPYLASWSAGPFKNKLKLRGLESLRPEIRAALAEPANAMNSLNQTFVPFDYGVYAFMADMEQLQAAKLSVPTSFSDLLQPQWRRNLILEDPRTSGPGLAFVLYANRLNAPKADEFWKRFRSQWLTLAPGWDAAYGLFLKREAPLVWSYTTSQAYHETQGQTGRYRALIFKEGQPLQIEGAALVNRGKEDKKRQTLARSFLEFLLSVRVQKKIPLKNWMLPVRKDIRLPPGFAKLPKPIKIIPLPTRASEIEKSLLDWQTVISQ